MMWFWKPSSLRTIFRFMNTPEDTLKAKLFQTLASLERVVGPSKAGLILRVNPETLLAIEQVGFKTEIPYEILCDLTDSELDNMYSKRKQVIYKWVWTIPSLKRSYAGRITTHD